MFDGGSIRLDLPFFKKAPTESETVKAASAPAVIQIEDPLHALLVSPASIDDETALFQAASRGYTGVVVEMKEDSGDLCYLSNLPLAEDSGASDGDPDRNEALRTINRTPNLHTVALVSCFRDSALADKNPGLALTRPSGAIWRDEDHDRWLNPASSEVRAYLCGVCKDLAELGFDEILLTNAGYPCEGKLSEIRKIDLGDAASRIQWINSFYKEVRETLKPYGVTLSVMTEGTVTLLGSNPDTGQTLNSLTELADRIWLKNAETEDVDLFEAGGLPNAKVNLVSVETKPSTADCSWAVFAPLEGMEE